MYANTANMLFDVEKGSANTFGTYTIDSMNFGIKQRPDTVITTAKSIEEITVVDSTGRNTLASLKYKNDGTIETKIGDILTTDVNSIVDISMEDDKLQGASMKIKYKVSTRQTNREAARINKFVDYIPNNLAFNLEIEDNKGNWQVVANKNDIKNYLANNRKSITDLYNVIVEATTDNKLTTGKDAVQTITLETKLSSTEATIEQIITSAEELIYEYKNTVEVLETHSEEAVVVKTIDLNGEIVLATLGGRISDPEHPGNPKTPEGAPDENDPTAPIITTSVDVAIHPPTGSEGLTITHFIIITSSLAVIGAGILLIKKYVLKK